MFVDFLLLPKLKHVRHLSSYFPFKLRIDDKFPVTDDKKKKRKTARKTVLTLVIKTKINKRQKSKRATYYTRGITQMTLSAGSKLLLRLSGKKLPCSLNALKYKAHAKSGKLRCRHQARKNMSFYAGKKCIRCNCTNHTTHDKRGKSRIWRRALVNMSLVPCAGKMRRRLTKTFTWILYLDHKRNNWGTIVH